MQSVKYGPSKASLFLLVGPWFAIQSIPLARAGIAALAPGTLVPGVIGIAIAVWMLSFRLILEADTLVYKRLFGGTYRIPWTEIESIRVEQGYRRLFDAFQPWRRLVVRTKNSQQPLVINFKVFPREALKRLKVLSESKGIWRS